MASDLFGLNFFTTASRDLDERFAPALFFTIKLLADSDDQ